MKKHFYQQLSNCCWIPLILAFANVTYKPIKNDNKILYFVFQKKKTTFHHAIITLSISSVKVITTFSINHVFLKMVEVNGRDIQHPFRLLPHGHKLKY